MRIAIVGVGKMGTGFAAALAGSHDVLLGSTTSRDVDGGLSPDDPPV